MLTAAAHGNLIRKIELYEDEVTSCIFGEMQYLSAMIIWNIFKQLTKDANIKGNKISNAFSEIPDSTKFEFWPRWEKDDLVVIPDVVIHFYKNTRALFHLLVEVKWNASLSPPCELIRQWSWGYSRRTDDAPWLQLYLVKDLAKGRAEVENSLSEIVKNCGECTLCEAQERSKRYRGGQFDFSDWQQSLGCIGWRHVIGAVTKCLGTEHYWSKGVSVFFAKQDIVPFIGFGWLNSENSPVSPTGSYEFFRRTPWFAFLDDYEFNEVLGDTVFFNWPDEPI